MAQRRQCFGCDAWFTPKKADDLFCDKCAKELDQCRQALREKDIKQLELFCEHKCVALTG